MAPSREYITMPSLGIVGGMGIEATQEFQQLITLATKVLGYDGERHIPPAKIDNELKPDRSAFILEEPGAISPVSAIAKGCNDVANAGASFIFMPCNTAHAFLDEITEKSPIPIISLIESTLWYIQKHYRTTREVGLLATNGSIASKRVWHPSFNVAGIDILEPEPKRQKIIMEAIYEENGVKSGYTKAKPIESVDDGQHPTIRFRQGVDHLSERFDPKKRYSSERKKIFIAGCTEVPLALLQSDMPENTILIDPMKIAALASVVICHDRDYQDYIRRTTGPDGVPTTERDKKEVHRLAKKAFMENRPITTSDMQALEEKAAERYPSAAPTLFSSSPEKQQQRGSAEFRVPFLSSSSAKSGSIDLQDSSSGDSSDDESSPSLGAISLDDVKEIISKHQCTVTKGVADRKPVLRLRFNANIADIAGVGVDTAGSSIDVDTSVIQSLPISAFEDANLDMKRAERYLKNRFNLTKHTQIRLHSGTVRSITVAFNDSTEKFFRDELGMAVGSEPIRTVSPESQRPVVGQMTASLSGQRTGTSRYL